MKYTMTAAFPQKGITKRVPLEHLISYGDVPALPAGELQIGDTVMYNYGATSKVVGLERKGTFIIISVRMTRSQFKVTDEVYTRKCKPTTLIPIDMATAVRHYGDK
jgi:hypothetical protein